MSGIRSIPVIPDFILVVGIDDSLRGLTKSLRSGTQKRLDKRFEGGDDEDRNRV